MRAVWQCLIGLVIPILLCQGPTPAVADAVRLVNEDALVIPAGRDRAVQFQAERPGRALLWIRARVEGPQREESPPTAAHVLSLRLDGVAIRPSNMTPGPGSPASLQAARVLNKKHIAAWTTPERKAIQITPVFADGGWALIQDEDYDFGPAPRWAGNFAIRPYLSHYYEYLLDIGPIAAGEHQLTLAAIAREAPADIHVAGVQLLVLDEPLLAWHQPWMQPLFPWQVPGADQVLTGERSLRITASAGEYEPLTFAIHALDNALAELSVAVSPLTSASGAVVAASQVDTFAVAALDRKSLGEAGFITHMPFVPEAWQRHSPELLIPLGQGTPSIARGHSQRFYLDVHVPADAAPGQYRGTITVRAGSQPVADLPLTLEVLPFQLAQAGQKYWMWRLTWSPPMWEPESVAALRDIAAHGFTGLTRPTGGVFTVRRDDSGALRVDGSGYRKAVAALRDAGLDTSLRDDGIATAALAAAVDDLNYKPRHRKDREWLCKVLIAAAEPELWREVGATLPENDAIGKAPPPLQIGVAEQEIDDALAMFADAAPELGAAMDPIDAPRSAADARAMTADEALATIRHRMLTVFKQVRQIIHDTAGDDGYCVFPVDEPDGTPYQRVWTRFVADLAHEAGLKTWSTRNTLSWPAHLDANAFGGVINQAYGEPQIIRKPYQGELRFNLIPILGGFRDGAKYHFKGDIDEVRIYQRALTDAEMRDAHHAPAADGLLAHYSFDSEPEFGRVRDDSGSGHDLSIVGDVKPTPGYSGTAMSFDGESAHLKPPTLRPRSMIHPDGIDVSKGWSISLWFRGYGPMFGHGYDFYTEGAAKLRYTTTEQNQAWFSGGGFQTGRFWQHVTFVFDPAAGEIRSYLHNREIREHYQADIHWNYVQIRSMPPQNPRYKTGLLAFYYGNLGSLTNITTFCYDWNTSHLYVVYPKDGERFIDGRSNPIWYRTMGWEGTREGIDDARYLQTLANLVMQQDGLTRAEAARYIQQHILGGIGPEYQIREVVTELGGYDAMRGRVIQAIRERLGV